MANFNIDQNEKELQATGHRVETEDAVSTLENGFESIELMDIVDVKAIQSMMDDFHHLTKIGVAIVDLKGNVLVATGWQDICTQFHRKHPESLKNCIESDLKLSAGIAPGSFKAYRCRNNMWDIATPIVVGGKHMGNLYLGQFFYDDEVTDFDCFRSQAKRYDFNETAYLTALDRVPRWRKETVHTVMRFYSRFTDLISKLSYSNLKLAHELRNRKLAETALRTSEEALRESEAKYRVLFEHAREALFVAQDGRIILQNPRCFELTGYSAEEFESRPFVDFIHEDDRDMVMDRHFRRLRGETQPERYSFRIFHKDGSILWAEINAVLIQWNGKAATLCFMTDITERKQAENNLRMAHEKMLTILDSIDSTIYVSDMDTYEILFMNKKMKTDFGGDKTGGICFKEFRKNKEVCDSCNNKQLLDENGRPAGVCTRHDQNPVTGRFYINYDRAVEWIDGRLVRLQIATDITDLKKMEARLIQAQKMESIGSLAGGIAHDFNNLLFPIVGLSEMMLEDFAPGSPEHYDVEQIFKAGKRGRELVQQILSFSRQSDYQLIPVHIQKILKEVFKLCRVTIPADIAIARDIQIDCRPVMADPTQIHQIAMNLITNAFHAVEPTGGGISIQFKEVLYSRNDTLADPLESGAYAMLSVSDTGSGIDPAIMNKIFDPYFTTKEKGQGTGLGLATVYGIVKAHGGDIRVYSEVGKGTSFHVYLPVLEKPADVVPEKQPQPLPTGTEHILLVDDEVPIVHLEKQMLERLGYRITSFTSSVDALAAFETDPSQFDLVISDMHMPNLTGVQLAKEMIALRPALPVILCTGFSESINRENADVMGIRGLLMKPVGMMDLAHKIREVIDSALNRCSW